MVLASVGHIFIVAAEPQLVPSDSGPGLGREEIYLRCSRHFHLTWLEIFLFFLESSKSFSVTLGNTIPGLPGGLFNV